MARYLKGEFLTVPNREKIMTLRGAMLNVYLALCYYSDDNGTCFPSYKRLASDTMYDTRQCKRAIELLVDEGLIERRVRTRANGSHTSNYYQLIYLEGVVTHTTPPSDTGVTPRSDMDVTPITKPTNKTKEDADASLRSSLEELISIINPRERVDARRIGLLRARLKDYTLEEVTNAAKAFSKSDWHKENKQMSIDNLLAPSKFGRWYAASQEESKRKFA